MLLTGGELLEERRGQRQLCDGGRGAHGALPAEGLAVGSWGSSWCWSSSSRAARGLGPQTDWEVKGKSSLKAEPSDYSFWRVFAFLDEAEAGILVFSKLLSPT